MKIYCNDNVLEAAIKRINYLFDEFEEVVVGMSGGKDSTVVFNIALDIARKKNRLPLKVCWIDQEAEWQGTVDYVSKIMNMPEVDPYWFQMPIVITNNASSYERFSHCWDEEKKDLWIHPKNPISKKVNKYGTDRFHDLFEKIFAVEFKDKKACYLAGVRCEENPKRAIALTYFATYKHITYGKVLNKKLGHYTFYPLYDWSYTDIWKYIQDNNIEYNKIYDEMYRYGFKVKDMRISNVHHETAIQILTKIQEIEPKTWERIVARIDGANTIKHLKYNSFTCPKELPYMFKDWEEYSLHLIENIIQEDKNKELIKKIIIKNKKIYADGNEKVENLFWKTIINTILSSDWDLTKYQNFTVIPNIYKYRNFKLGKIEKIKICDIFNDKELSIIREDQKKCKK